MHIEAIRRLLVSARRMHSRADPATGLAWPLPLGSRRCLRRRVRRTPPRKAGGRNRLPHFSGILQALALLETALCRVVMYERNERPHLDHQTHEDQQASGCRLARRPSHQPVVYNHARLAYQRAQNTALLRRELGLEARRWGKPHRQRCHLEGRKVRSTGGVRLVSHAWKRHNCLPGMPIALPNYALCFILS